MSLISIIYSNSSGVELQSHIDTTLKNRILTTFFTYGVSAYYGKDGGKQLDAWFLENVEKLEAMSQDEFDAFIFQLAKDKRVKANKTSNVDPCDQPLAGLVNSPQLILDIVNRKTLMAQIALGLNKRLRREQIWFRNVDANEHERQDKSSYLLGLCKLWNLVHLFYPYKDILELNYMNNFNYVFDFYKLQDSTNLGEGYYVALSQIARLTNDCHNEIINDELRRKVFGDYYPALGLQYDNGIFTISNISDALRDTFGLKIGDTVTNVNGMPVNNYCDSLLYARCCATRDYVTRYYVLRGHKNTTVELQIKGLDKPITLDRIVPYSFSINYGTEDPILYDGFAMINDSTAYIRGNLSKTGYKHFQASEYKYLVFDMTFYPTRFSNYILGSLLGDSAAYRIGPQTGYDCFDRKKAYFNYLWFLTPTISKQLTKIYVLQDDGTGSWGESIVLGLHNVYLYHVEFWGENTSGTMGSALRYELPGNVYYRSTSDRQSTVDGTIYQFSGVPPDHYFDMSQFVFSKFWKAVYMKKH